MGDSAGGNLAYQLLTRAQDIPTENVIGTVLISPWIDVSSTQPSRQTYEKLGATTDVMSVSIMHASANLSIFGIDDHSKDEHPIKKHPSVSPFFVKAFKVIPRPLVVYSYDECFGPGIKDWIKRWSACQKVKSFAHHNAFHDNTIISILMTLRGFAFSRLGKYCLEDIERIAEHCVQVYKESLRELDP
jgi:acetyl esterase/lipase